jgi:hypothetical protein
VFSIHYSPGWGTSCFRSQGITPLPFSEPLPVVAPPLSQPLLPYPVMSLHYIPFSFHTILFIDICPLKIHLKPCETVIFLSLKQDNLEIFCPCNSLCCGKKMAGRRSSLLWIVTLCSLK